MNEKWVAITGCNGYLGGQAVIKFKELGYKVLGVDNSTGIAPWIQEYIDQYVPGDFSSTLFCTAVASKNARAVIHLAGNASIPRSFEDPVLYYNNHLGSTVKLMKNLANKGWNRLLIYASSAAVYGDHATKILSEDNTCQPISPYGRSVLMTEQALRDCAVTYNFKVFVLRLFNSVGADSKVRHGVVRTADDVVSKIIKSVISKGVFIVNGTDYATADGTCVRDYIHCEDAAQAVVNAAVVGEEAGEFFDTFNVGSGKGSSVEEVIQCVERITGRSVLVHRDSRRSGDATVLVSSCSKFKHWSGWRSQQSQLENIVRTSWAWHNSKLYQDYA